MLPVEMPDSSVACDARLVLDEELARLSERYRAAIVLCELEGLSRRQAAAQLGISEGTLSSRLARAKMQLKDRLTRRGLALSSVALAALLAQDALAVAVRPGLAESTIQLATLVSSGSSLAGIVSAPVATLTEGVLKAMLIAKMKSVFLGITTLALVTTGVGVLAQTAGPGPSPDDRLKAVERKLDRLLEVLGGANRSAPVLAAQPANVPTAATPAVPEFVPPPAHSAVSPSPGMPPTPFVKWKPTTPSALAPRVVQGRPAAVADVPTPVGGNQRPRGSAARSNPNRAQSLAGRVEAVEHRIGEIERRLAALERRLEQHSGGAAVPGSSSPLFYPTPAPPAPPSAPAKAVVPGLPANPSSDAAPTAPPTEAGPAAGVPNSNPTPPVPVGDQPTTPPSDELSPDRPQK